MATSRYCRWPGGGTARVLQKDLARFQRCPPPPRREFSSTRQVREGKDDGKVPINQPQTPVRAPSDSHASSSTGIGSRSSVGDQRPNNGATDATDPPLRIIRQVRDFPAPSSPRRSDGSAGASRPVGPRLELSPEVKARIEANRKARGSAAAKSGGILRAVGRGLPGGQSGGKNARGRFRGPRGRRRQSDDVEDDEADDQDQGPAASFSPWEPPPRQTIDHVPEQLSLDDLRVDWPIVPTGQVGMVECVSSKLRWMARRMQHDYESPHDLALRMHRGELVHFQSDTEREEVVKLARGLAEQRAGRLTDRRAETVPVRDASFRAVGDRDRTVLADDLIKGLYSTASGAGNDDEKDGNKEKGGEEKKYSHAFLRVVDTALCNNHTYHGRDRDQLIATIHQVLDRPVQPSKTQTQQQA